MPAAVAIPLIASAAVAGGGIAAAKISADGQRDAAAKVAKAQAASGTSNSGLVAKFDMQSPTTQICIGLGGAALLIALVKK